MTSRTIIVEHVYPPIPDRQFDYCATWDGWDLGEPQGWGATPSEAIDDLLSNFDMPDNAILPDADHRQRFLNSEYLRSFAA